MGGLYNDDRFEFWITYNSMFYDYIYNCNHKKLMYFKLLFALYENKQLFFKNIINKFIIVKRVINGS